MYNQGTLEEFDTWHNARIAEYGLLDGVYYSFTIKHPTTDNTYIWEHAGNPEGTSLTKEDVESLGYVTRANK